jgi:protein-L-isoaspartate(D-aspartate) O-methyltransferase
MTLIDSLIESKWLRTPEIIDAFKKVKRSDFMPENIKSLWQIDEAMPIGFNQTISQPLTVAFMLEELQPKKGNNILDIGSGSGWTTALLSCIAGSKGKVVGMEIIKELKEFGEKNAAKFVRKGIAEFVLGNGCNGYEKYAPFDRILVSASALKVPSALKKQLKVGGRMVIPVKESIITIVKKSEKDFKETEHPGFVFVPLV